MYVHTQTVALLIVIWGSNSFQFVMYSVLCCFQNNSLCSHIVNNIVFHSFKVVSVFILIKCVQLQFNA